MQCASCRFENMPQQTQCVRCGASLIASDPRIAITPPRAGAWEKRLRVASILRAIHLQFDSLGRVGHSLHLDDVAAVTFRSCNVTTAAMFWRAIVPGLPQWYLGRLLHARVFFFGYLIALAVTLLTLGTSLSTITLGLIGAFHLMSLIDAASTLCSDRSDRFALLSVMVIGAILLFYLPTSSLLWNRFGIQQVVGTVGPFQDGDTLLFRRSWTAAPPPVGELVLYNAPTVQYNTPGAINRLTGPMFERVLAVAGQEVAWRGGLLTVDGVAPAVPPLGRTGGLVPDVQFVVPEQCCYIAPLATLQQGIGYGNALWFGFVPQRNLRMPTDSGTWQQMGIVPYGSVYGTVWGVRRGLFSFVNIEASETPLQRGIDLNPENEE